MPSSRYVATANELKKALDDKVDDIIITDKKLAFAVRVIHGTGYKTLSVIATAAGAAAVCFWNPMGWFSGAAAGSAGTAALTASYFAAGGAGAAAAAGLTGGAAAVLATVVVVLGVLGLTVLVMHKDYALDIEANAGGKVDHSGDKPEISGNSGFKMKLKRNGT